MLLADYVLSYSNRSRLWGAELRAYINLIRHCGDWYVERRDGWTRVKVTYNWWLSARMWVSARAEFLDIELGDSIMLNTAMSEIGHGLHRAGRK
jgi:hypothetical protein